MQEQCTHDCKTCSSDCGKKSKSDLLASPHALSHIKKIVGVVSGKGGVGKSLVTSLLSATANKLGLKTAILDADITGPSIPKMFGVDKRVEGEQGGIFPAETAMGTKLISINLLLDDPTVPVLWRGPVIAGAVRQFWTDVIWGDIDCMFIDMPPGTGDVPLTVFQSIPIDAVIMVTSPQDLVSMIVEKAVNMAKKMDIPIFAAIENYSYIKCPDCDKIIEPFGKSKLPEFSQKIGIDIEKTVKMPIDPALATLCDKGLIEKYDGDLFDELVKSLIAKDFLSK